MKDKDDRDDKSGLNNNERQPIGTDNNRPARSQNVVDKNKPNLQNREPRALIIWTAILALGTVAILVLIASSSGVLVQSRKR